MALRESPRNRSRDAGRRTHRRPLRGGEARRPSCRRAMTGAFPCGGCSAGFSSVSRSRGSARTRHPIPRVSARTPTRRNRRGRAGSFPSGSARPPPTGRAAAPPSRSRSPSAASRAPRGTRARGVRRPALARRSAREQQQRRRQIPGGFGFGFGRGARVVVRRQARALDHQRRRVPVAIPPRHAVHDPLAHPALPPRHSRRLRLRARRQHRPRRDIRRLGGRHVGGRSLALRRRRRSRSRRPAPRRRRQDRGVQGGRRRHPSRIADGVPER